jgi:hypothetical protein
MKSAAQMVLGNCAVSPSWRGTRLLTLAPLFFQDLRPLLINIDSEYHCAGIYTEKSCVSLPDRALLESIVPRNEACTLQRV